MVKSIEVVPDPVSLIESMRAVGYTADTAVADVVDNSISANALNIQIEYDAMEDPYVAILDDGIGMNSAEITNAMRHGSRNPTDCRKSDDLGRFGLGLKTASLSQGRKLTVLSKQGNIIEARCWDLDFVLQENKWAVVIPTLEEQYKLPLYDQFAEQRSGTLVVWQNLDRMMAGSLKPSDEMRSRMAGLHQHLSFVFHRFTQKEGRFPSINIKVNGLKLDIIDPFLKTNNFTQPMEGQKIRVDETYVEVLPYVLPHMNHLKRDDVALAGGHVDLRNNQGFYIYRNRRLVLWGTWFRLVPKEEFYKLTRVQVDIPNSLDHLWSLDIKKSAAYPPDIIRDRLRELIPRFANSSRLTVTYPGRKKQINTNYVPVWERIEPEHGSFRYQINMDHPVVRRIAENLDVDTQRFFQDMLDMISLAIPYESIYSDMCFDISKEHSSKIADDIIALAEKLTTITKLPLDRILTIEPIASYPQYHDIIRKELKA